MAHNLIKGGFLWMPLRISEDDMFEEALIAKYHLVTKEMEWAGGER